MNLAADAYTQLYGDEPLHIMVIKYHGGLNGYNATVRKTQKEIVFHLSRSFEECEPEIQLGVMQFLLNKLNKTKVRSDNIEMYHTFLRKMSDIAPVTKSDPELELSFKRCNEEYFGGLMSQPNLIWGGMSTSLLGTYTYATDTIMISQAMRDDQNLMDYVMHHEMLHKKHKFNHSASRTHSHTKAFRIDEAKFSDKQAEQKLRHYLSHKRRSVSRAPRQKPNFVQRLMGWT